MSTLKFKNYSSLYEHIRKLNVETPTELLDYLDNQIILIEKTFSRTINAPKSLKVIPTYRDKFAIYYKGKLIKENVCYFTTIEIPNTKMQLYLDREVTNYRLNPKKVVSRFYLKYEDIKKDFVEFSYLFRIKFDIDELPSECLIKKLRNGDITDEYFIKLTTSCDA